MYLTYLQKLYVSRLDSSLIASIASEATSLEGAKRTLEPLAQAAEKEELHRSSTLSSSVPPADVSTTSEDEYIKIDGLSEQEAFQFLRMTFSRPSDSELRELIRTSGGDVRKALDALLNIEERHRNAETVEAPKLDPANSADSDEEDSIWAQRRPAGATRPKGPTAAKTQAFPALGRSLSPQRMPIGARSQSPIRSKWDALNTQIIFLSGSLSLPLDRVRSVFHLNGSSLPRTLRDLLGDVPKGRADEDVVANLKMTFKHVDIESLQKIVLATKHNLDNALELARILEHDKYYNIDIIGQTKKPSPPKLVTSTMFVKPTPPVIRDDGEGTFEDMTVLRQYYLDKRNEAFTAASQSYRQSKSNPQFSGVTAYYAELGRDYDAKFRQYSHLSANRLVASQSSLNILDLHGISVKDAVRLVEEGVTAWWARVKVIRERGEVRALESYVIIVGKGDRQKGGSKLGPPVGAWLRREGWGFKEAQGEFVVWGLRKFAKEG